MWSYHQYHNQRPPRQRRRRRRRRPRPRPRPRRRRRASAGVLAATFTAVAKLVTPTAVPTVVPTALMHQNKAIATAATAFARNLRGALDLLPVPEGNGLCPIRFTRPFFSRICASKRRHPRFKGHSAATDKRGGGLLFVLSLSLGLRAIRTSRFSAGSPSVTTPERLNRIAAPSDFAKGRECREIQP